MKRLKVLSFRPRVEDGFGGPVQITEFEQAVSKLTDYKNAGKKTIFQLDKETIDEIITRIYGDDDPDWVFICPLWLEIPKKRDYKVGYYLTDLHGYYKTDKDQMAFIRLLNSKNLDAVFMKYQYIRGIKYPKNIHMRTLKSRKFLLPWSINPEKFKPRSKIYDISLIGSISDRYPIREIVYKELPSFCKERGLSFIRNKTPQMHKHAAWHGANKYLDDPRFYLHKRYEDALSRSRFFIFDCSIYGYPLAKFFEGMSSGCIVVADKPEQASELGFVDGETYVEITAKNWKDRLDYYLSHPEEADEIAKNARRLILKRHTHELRAKQFLRMLEDF